MKPEREAAEERVAHEYAERIVRGQYAVDWHDYNRGIIARWSVSALMRIKRRAWKIVEAQL